MVVIVWQPGHIYPCRWAGERIDHLLIFIVSLEHFSISLERSIIRHSTIFYCFLFIPFFLFCNSFLSFLILIQLLVSPFLFKYKHYDIYILYFCVFLGFILFYFHLWWKWVGVGFMSWHCAGKVVLSGGMLYHNCN